MKRGAGENAQGENTVRRIQWYRNGKESDAEAAREMEGNGEVSMENDMERF